MDPRIKTKAYTYVLPFLADEVLDIKKNLVNVFLADEDRPELKDHIFLLYKFSADEEFLRFEEEVTWSVYYETQYDCDKLHVMIVFKRPECWDKEMQLILKGRYSETSKKYKRMMTRFHELPEFSQIVGVLHRKEFAYKAMDKLINEGLPEEHWTIVPRNQEASSIMNMATETYTEDRKVKDVLGAQQNNFINEGEN
jgi:hypothetical protein